MKISPKMILSSLLLIGEITIGQPAQILKMGDSLFGNKELGNCKNEI